MTLAILSLGTALPPARITADQAERAARAMCCQTDEQAALMRVLYRQSGIQSRHVAFPQDFVDDVLNATTDSQSVFLPTGQEDDRGPRTHDRMQFYEQHAFPIALESARRALANAAQPARSITHLVTVSCTGFAAPGIDIRLIKALELDPGVQRTHIGFMGCHGAINGLRVARAYTGADPEARVLLCAVELCSLHYHYGWNPKRMVANALFADGAAALVGIPVHAAGPECWTVAGVGSCVFPDSENAMTWNIGDHGFDMTLSTRVPNLIGAHLRPWLASWLDRQGFKQSDIASWAIHPGGPRILRAVEAALGLARNETAVSEAVLAEYGNMSSPTILFILDRLQRQRAPRPCVVLGFGPGLVVEAALFV